MAGSRSSTGIPEALTLIDTGPSELAGLLAGNAMFDGFSESEIETLAAYMRAYRAEKDTVVFIEGAHAGFMGIVIEGRLNVFKDSGRGATRAIRLCASTGRSATFIGPP